MSDILDLGAWADALLAQLDAPARRKLMRAIATELRDQQRRRIAEQQNPDGSAYEPRKPQLRQRPGRLRRAMFIRLRTGKHLKASAGADGAVVKFFGGAQRLAAVHHFGLRDRVNKAGLEVTYPRRRLLGFGDADVERIKDLLFIQLRK